ncbi:YrzQ family protein [Bacillus timonensis]|nr:YrzQ family protein [Bacillus timonensis]
MNKTMTSIVAMGLGAAAYSMAQRNKLMSNRTMKQLRKRVTKALF